jgi:hypothetical protein
VSGITFRWARTLNRELDYKNVQGISEYIRPCMLPKEKKIIKEVSGPFTITEDVGITR